MTAGWQNVSYNSQNATVVNTRPGYVTTLLFDDDETVIDAQAGFPKRLDGHEK
ncbi:Type IV secretory pathway, VirB9 components [Raoultella planticola]|uniref:Type IV secretory pathway, VirB9 components n=1 Tax=Raoultella planticola TaxID=575 RepID=A0A485CS99_RAOPL|nr:Type IV secretory pathway, VirB9 components [Raoultella planticola]